MVKETKRSLEYQWRYHQYPVGLMVFFFEGEIIMANILKKEQLAPVIWRFRIDAPRIAKKRRAGQFIILRPTSDGERIPLTIAGADPSEGWIEIVFQVAGKTTSLLADLSEGEEISDLAGPLGKPTHIEKFGNCVCIGGGVGIAPLLPIVKALHEAGNAVTSILGARNAELLILKEDFDGISDRTIEATDDGSLGLHGFVSDALKGLLGKGEKFDFAVVVGPVPMMKITSGITVGAGIRTVVSLNPIMIDGTGMCGGCRVSIGGSTKFACVDGPEFDASLVNWDELRSRLDTYKEMEKADFSSHQCKIGSVS